MLHRTTVRRADLIEGTVSAGLGDRASRERAETIVMASALSDLLHLIEIRGTPQRMLHAVLNRMKREAQQRG
jgi:hypothetical protein